jgi:hypothetical protein
MSIGDRRLLAFLNGQGMVVKRFKTYSVSKHEPEMVHVSTGMEKNKLLATEM